MCSCSGSLLRCCVDQFADVITGRFERQWRKRAANRDATRERVDVFVQRHGFVITGDRDDPVIRLAYHRPLCAEIVEIRVGIGNHRWIGEEVDAIEIGHWVFLSHCGRRS